jgi:hypothetical protein
MSSGCEDRHRGDEQSRSLLWLRLGLGAIERSGQNVCRTVTVGAKGY